MYFKGICIRIIIIFHYLDDIKPVNNNQLHNFATANHNPGLSSPLTPVSNLQNNASPAPSPFHEETLPIDIGSLSPSWPNTPLSPVSFLFFYFYSSLSLVLD